jgi:hypothetical protein
VEQAEEGDQWGLLPGVEADDLQILQDYKEWARTTRGERILEHLRKILHAGETITMEELMTEQLAREGKFIPIDVNALLIRTGMRRAWALIDAHVNGLDNLEKARNRK